MKNKLLLDNLKIVFNTPWKLFFEIGMYFIKPFVFIYLKLMGVQIGKGAKFYGFPRVFKHKGSDIVIGNNFESRSWKYSNPLGVDHATIICTWEKGAKIKIGNDVGITGGSIVSAKSIEIGNRVLIGANSTIMDTDFHPIRGDRRYEKKGVKSKPVEIGDNVFIGMESSLLKGVKLTDNSIIPAGRVVRQ